MTGTGGASATDWLRASHAAGPGRAGLGWARRSAPAVGTAAAQPLLSPEPRRPPRKGPRQPRGFGHEVGAKRRHLCGEVSGASAPSFYPGSLSDERRGRAEEGKGILMMMIIF